VILKDKIFREYDIRGVVDEDFDADFAWALGRAFAQSVVDANVGRVQDSASLKVGVGRDCRLTGPALASSLIEGLRAGGVSVVDSGMGPTPQLYFSVYKLNLDGGIQVTGSHNPPDMNGFKMMIGRTTLSGEMIQELKAKVIDCPSRELSAQLKGALDEFDARSDYIAELTERSKPYMGERKLKVVVDAGNGVGGMVGPEVLRNLGCEVIELYTEPDGNFPNHHPDPTELKNIVELTEKVLSEQADIGIGWDGDADRIGVVDEKGDVVFGDMLLILYGRKLLEEVSNPTIIGDVKCSEILFQDLRSKGANAVMARTGHSLIKAKLKELDAELAGEMSGHMFFKNRYYGFDDALHASARLVEMLSSTEKSISELLSDLPKMESTPEIRVDCPDEVKFKVIEQAQRSFKEYQVNTLDGVRITFPNGWGLVRASNTQPVLVMRFEAGTSQELSDYRSIVEDKIKEIRAKI
jgi:phosphomannomutase/phosphoglucomutase